MSFKGVVVAGTRDMVGASEALVNSMTRVIDNAGDWLEREFQMQQAQRDRGEFFNPGMGGGMPTGHRAAGGPVSAGQHVLVGEQGPEIFRPHGVGIDRRRTAAAATVVKRLLRQRLDHATWRNR